MALSDNKAKIQALLAGINALPEAGSGGVELPTLSNPAVAVDIVVGKEAIDGEGNVLTGTNPYVKTATDEVVADQTDLITQIKTALDGKTAGGGGSSSSVYTATASVASNSQQISFTGLSSQPKAFAIVPTGNITLNTSNRFVANVLFDGNTTHGVYCYGSGGWNATYTAGYSAAYFTHTYSGGTLTVRTSSATNGGYFAANVAYKLIAI